MRFTFIVVTSVAVKSVTGHSILEHMDSITIVEFLSFMVVCIWLDISDSIALRKKSQ